MHSAAASIVDGIFDVTVSTADRIATFGRPRPTLHPQIDRILDDVAFDVEVRGDIDRGVGDEDGLGIGRHVHDEDVTDAPGGPKSGRTGGDGPHQFVGVQAALHQQLTLRLADHLDRFRRRRVAVRHVDDLRTFERDAVLLGDRLDLVCGADQHGLMMPSWAASIAPRSEVSSHGCTTSVIAGGTTLFALAMQTVVLGARRRTKRTERGDGILASVCDAHFFVLPL